MDENKTPMGKNPKESSDELLNMLSRYGEKNRAAAKELARKTRPEDAGAENAAQSAAKPVAAVSEDDFETDAGPGYEPELYEKGEAEFPAGRHGIMPPAQKSAAAASEERPDKGEEDAERKRECDAASAGEARPPQKKTGAAGQGTSAHYGDGFEGAVRPVPEGGHLTDGDGNAVFGRSAEEDAFSPSHFVGSEKTREKARKAYRRAKFRNAKKKSNGSVTLSVAKAIAYIVLVCCLSFFTVFGFFDVWPGVIPIADDIFSFRDKGDGKVIVDIKEDMTTDEVADLLAEKNIIEEKKVFKFYVRYKYDKNMGIDKDDLGGSAVRLAKEFCKTMFTRDGGGNDGEPDIKYLAGERTLSPKMNYDQLLQALTSEEYHREQVTVTVPEGYTAQQIIELLLSKGIGTRDGFVYAINEYPYKHEFVELLNEQSWKDGRLFRLEGYLYPDTYLFYKDSSEVEVVNKMLNSFNNRVWAEYYTTYKPVCEAEKLTFDEMITLASVVQSEGKSFTDFENVSQVFHSRRDSGMQDFARMESCATVQYAIDFDNAEKGLHIPRKPVLNDEDLKYVSPYNTYTHEGLPPGAICNPGLDAIDAALYPDLSPQVKEEFGITTAYYFNSDMTGKMYYAQTPYQHSVNKQRADAVNKKLSNGN